MAVVVSTTLAPTRGTSTAAHGYTSSRPWPPSNLRQSLSGCGEATRGPAERLVGHTAQTAAMEPWAGGIDAEWHSSDTESTADSLDLRHPDDADPMSVYDGGSGVWDGSGDEASVGVSEQQQRQQQHHHHHHQQQQQQEAIELDNVPPPAYSGRAQTLPTPLPFAHLIEEFRQDFAPPVSAVNHAAPAPVVSNNVSRTVAPREQPGLRTTSDKAERRKRSARSAGVTEMPLGGCEGSPPTSRPRLNGRGDADDNLPSRDDEDSRWQRLIELLADDTFRPGDRPDLIEGAHVEPGLMFKEHPKRRRAHASASK